MAELSRIPVGFCPECDTRIRFHQEPRLGQLVTCRECGEISEVVGLHPVELDWAYVEKEQDYPDSDYYRRHR